MSMPTDAYRVFVSYSHDDLPLAQGIVGILESNGLKAMWDQNFKFGHGFHDQIRDFIAFSHVFLPIITPTSSQRGWVHQEIGYAMALNVPVLPVAVGAFPGQMIEQLNAIKMEADVESLRGTLSQMAIKQLVSAAAGPTQALSLCAAEDEDRSQLVTKLARGVWALGGRGRVRQRQSLSTFSVPEKPVNHALWKARYGPNPRSTFQCDLLRNERLSLGEHARDAGCWLILDLSRQFDRYDLAVRISRLKVLRDFLSSMPDELVRVGITSIPPGEAMLIVGDWFHSQSLSAQGSGYRQTVFTRHAPSIRPRVEDFDLELADILHAGGIEPEKSRRAAIEQIEAVIGECGGR